MKLELLTERLRLSPFSPGDLDIALEMFTNPAVLKYADGAMDADEIRSSMSNWNKRGADGCIGTWCVTDRDTGEKYGSVALLPLISQASPFQQDRKSRVLANKVVGGVYFHTENTS